MSQQPEYSYKPGTIRSLKLVNFMCHESFEVKLGPRVNFVIGPNGSGKSALLTALVVVLGGRATTTSRAKRANEFVMYGKKYAKVTCVIHNYEKIMEKDQAFKPDDYGKRIIIEKIIYTEESSRLVLKNDKDKKVSERKQELDDMLEHFGILINNPICILNQEISKSFLHSKKPEDKFELFMKATNLEQIEHDYENAKQNHNDWNECNNRKSVGFRVLDSEYMSCKEKVSFLINRARLQDTHRELNRELVWAMIRDYENKAEQTQQKIESYIQAIENYNSDTEKRKDLIEKSKLRVEQQKIKLQTCNQECEFSRKKLDDNRRKDTTIRMRRVDVEHRVDAEKRKVARLERDKESLEKSITDLRRKLTNDNSVEENERRKVEIERLEREMPSEKAREKSIRQHTDQLAHSMNDTRSELHKATTRINELKNELYSKQSTLRRLKGGEKNALEKYGDHMIRICAEIEDYHKNGHFQKKPLGPLGYYIRLKSPDVAHALELHLGRNAYAFTCDNIKDTQTLQALIKKVRQQSHSHREFREPLVLIRKANRRHDTSRFKAQHDRYKTLLDYIDVSEDAVYNALVDRTSLETVLFIPDYKEAENLMITPPLIPRWTRCAYTRDCHIMYPRTQHGGYRCITGNINNTCLFSRGNADQIRALEKAISLIEADIRDLEANTTRLQESYDVQRREHDSNYQEIRKILEGIRKREQELLNLKTTLTVAQPEELSAFESELESCLSKIAEAKIMIERESAILASINDEHDEVAKEREAIMELSKQRDQERQKVQDLINKENDAIKTHQDTIKENQLSIATCTTKKEEETKNIEKHHDEIASARRNVNDSDKPAIIRETSIVQAEMKKVERQLNTEIEENTDPDELLASLRKRIREIENLVELKDHNQQNFNMSSKVLKDREDGYKSLRSFTCSSVSTTFSSVMRAMGMNGMLRIHLDDYVVDGDIVSKAKTLEMSIDTTPTQRPGGLTQNAANNSNIDENSFQQQASRRRSTRSQPANSDGGPRRKRVRVDVSPSEKENKLKMTDTRSLSGGERSFSTVAFVLALWHHCSSPFKLMDEIDVFMDMVTRRLSYNALIKFAQITENPGQFIFFSPLELPRIDDTENLVRVFEMPKIIRKGTQPSVPVAGTSFAGTAGGDE